MSLATESLEIGSVVAVAIAALLGSLLSSLTGSGGAAIIAFVLVPIIGVGAIVQTISVAMVVSHITRIGVFWQHIHWPTCLLVMAASMPGCVFGALIYTQLDERTISVILGAFLILMVIGRRLMPKDVGPMSRPAIIAIAFTYGLIAGTTIGGGVLILFILLSAGLRGMALVGTDSAIGLASHLVKLAVFSTTDVLTAELALVGAVVGLCMVPGTFLARWMLRRIPLSIHTVLVDAAIVIGGLGLIFRAFTSGQ